MARAGVPARASSVRQADGRPGAGRSASQIHGWQVPYPCAMSLSPAALARGRREKELRAMRYWRRELTVLL
jgi:hypothetical protein